MLKRLTVIGCLLALPAAAHAQSQLRMLQQQQIWRLQQQERQQRAQQDTRLQDELLQQQSELPPMPDPNALSHSDAPADRLHDLSLRRQFQLQQQQQQIQLMQQQQQQLLQQHLMQQQPLPQPSGQAR